MLEVRFARSFLTVKLRLEHLTDRENWKVQALPLARVKKIMKSEEIILQEIERERQQQEGLSTEEKPAIKFMISAEAPLLMSKACELLIKELSSRAWLHTERNRRRTLQKQDVHAAVGESEVYDFLIDIVPRVAGSPTNVPDPTGMANMPIQAPVPPPPIINASINDFQLNDPLQSSQFNSFMYQVPHPTLDGGGDNGQLGLIHQPGGQTPQQQHHQLPQWTDP